MSKREGLVIVLVLFLILGINIHYLHMKSGYYVDEGMTMVLSNGHYNGAVTANSQQDLGDFIRTYVWKPGEGPIDAVRNVIGMLRELMGAGNYSTEGTVAWYDDAREMLRGTNTWMSGSDLRRELTADKGERFAYGQVYLNQVLDVHPLFYYLLVHTVFSIFPGVYTDAFLFGINMLFLLMTCFVMYLMVREFWNSKETALLSVILYGFSQGFISCAVYFRMYAVLSFFVILTLYLHLKIRKSNGAWIEQKKHVFYLCMAVFLGFNTHYYYIVFLFPLFIDTCIRMRKNKKLMGKYIKSMIITGAVSLIVWPFSVYHILFGYRGTEAVSNVFSQGLIGKLYGYLSVLGKAFFLGDLSSRLSLFLMGVWISGMIWIAVRKHGSKECFLYPEMLIPSAVFLLIIAQIAPAVSDRYMMCLFPVVAIMMAVTLTSVLRTLIRSDKLRIGMYAGCAAVALLAACLCIVPNYLFLELRGKTLELPSDKNEYNCLMVGSDRGQGFSEAVKLSEFHEVLVVGAQELDDVTKPDRAESGTVIYVFEALDVDEILTRVSEQMALSENYTEISSDMYCFRAFLYE